MPGDVARLMLSVGSDSIPIANARLQQLSNAAQDVASKMAIARAANTQFTMSVGGILVPTSSVTRQTEALGKAIRTTGDSAKKGQKDFTDLFKELLNARTGMEGTIGSFLRLGTGAYLVGRAIQTTGRIVVGAIRPFIESAAAIETMRASYTALLGSSSAGGSMVSFIQDLSTTIPVVMKSMSDGTKTLLGFGFTANEIRNIMPKLAQVAQGNSEAFGHLAVVYGQVRAQGKMYMNDIRQFTNAGVPMIEALAEVVRAPQSAIGNMIRDGKIGISETKAALELLTAEGGRFHTTLIGAANTLNGQLSLAANNFKLIFADIGKGPAGFGTEFMKGVNNFLILSRAQSQLDRALVPGKKIPTNEASDIYNSVQGVASYFSADDLFTRLTKQGLIDQLNDMAKKYPGIVPAASAPIDQNRMGMRWATRIPEIDQSLAQLTDVRNRGPLINEKSALLGEKASWESAMLAMTSQQVGVFGDMGKDEIQKALGFDMTDAAKNLLSTGLSTFDRLGYNTNAAAMDPMVRQFVDILLPYLKDAKDEPYKAGQYGKYGVPYSPNNWPSPSTDPWGQNNSMRASYTQATGMRMGVDQLAFTKELEYTKSLLTENTKEWYAMDAAIKQATQLEDDVAALQDLYNALGITKAATYDAAIALRQMVNGIGSILKSGAVELFQTIGKSMYQASQGSGDFANDMAAFMASIVQQSGALMINAGLSLICTGHIVAGLALLALGGLTSIVGAYKSEEAADNGNNIARDAAYAADLLQWYLQAEAFNRQGYKETAALTGYANGTNNAAGGWSIVGERGPELQWTPPGATIIPNHKLQHFANGTGGGLTIEPKVIINNFASGAVASSRKLDNGDVVVTIANAIRSGKLDRALASRRGGRSMGN